MKKITLLFALCLAFSLTTKAQAPQGFNYQAVARTSAGVAVTSQPIGLQIRLLQGTATGTAVYTETHSVTSNNIGLLNVVVGSGLTVDNFAAINWANGPYYVEVSMDISGGTSYALMGTQQLMSVPYALYAANGGTAGPAGVTGATGSVGATGDIGPTGVTGNAGPTGATGSSGNDGDRYAATSTDMLTIAMGTQNLNIQTGLQYSVGQTVLIANSVSDFMKGNCVSYNSLTGALVVNITIIGGSGTFSSWSINLDGAPGPAGTMGATGATGTAGTNGLNGVTGATGSNGTNGAAGATGATGTNGTNGIAGATGTNGTDGATGATGTNGTNGINGATGATGATGAGVAGATGATGTNGTNGAAGATGATGTAATYAVAFNLVDNGAFTAWLIGNTSDYNSGSNSNPTLTLYRGFTYQFNVNVSGHPFRIQSVNTAGGLLYSVGVSAQNVQNGIMTFKVPMDAPTQLYYYCQFHSGMKGIINIP